MINTNNRAAKKSLSIRALMVTRDDRLLSQGTIRQARTDFLKLRKFVSVEKDKNDKDKKRENEMAREGDLIGHAGRAGRYLTFFCCKYMTSCY